MKSYHFSSLKLMTSLCLLLFVSLAATRLQAQAGTKHTTSYAVWEVKSGHPKTFALWNKHAKKYLAWGKDDVSLGETSNFQYWLEELSNGKFQVEWNYSGTQDISIACCQGNDNYVYPTQAGTSKDDFTFEEVEKDIYRIKFKDTGAYLTVSGNGEIYGTTIKMGDHQLWMITGR